MRSHGEIKTRELGHSWEVRVSTALLENEGRKIVSDITHKLNKKSFHITVCYPKSEARTEADALQRFSEETGTTGAKQSIFYLGEKVHILTIAKKGGLYGLKLTDKAKELLASAPAKQANTVERKAESEEKKTTPTNSGNVETIADPNSSKAQNLIGRLVELSRSFSFTDKKVVRLTGIDALSSLPFFGVNDEGKQFSGVFIREHVTHIRPYNLSDENDRDLLRGKWIRNNVTGHECMVTSFRKENGSYTCNGMDARTLLTSCSFLDGKAIGHEE